ncbi:succinate dehydrogenase cytochrome b560 subunit [Coprinellus micaceus]|uniref:Succinate dehydrogenase cytochrome b560 subunit n=1 Tax=Coprinellus micaceus TaxID=71717 RepID=A0A4Y7SN04_COPMI|nr:succinate dehydrogenase cytochrome b560 subunit [Coprinellus micaceus]
MMTSRVLGLGPALRQAAFAPRAMRSNAIIRNAIGRRSIKTNSLTPQAGDVILNNQRLKRPSSPHFTIYQPQLTWLGSIANRVTGAGLSVLLYAFGISYLVAPGTFDSQHVVAFVHDLPEAVKYAGKFILAAPFSFHAINGLRHLAWDSGKFLSVKGAYSTGYAVLGASAISTVVLLFQ